MDRVVGISEYAISADRDDVLVTYSLGSCVALVAYDPVAGLAGLLHAMLPSAKANPEKAAAQPAMYVDAGATMMLQEMFNRGATRSNLVAKVIGAASRVENDSFFRIGDRNYAIIRKVLWKNGILIAAEDVGGTISRTVRHEVGSTRTTVRSENATAEL